MTFRTWCTCMALVFLSVLPGGAQVERFVPVTDAALQNPDD